MNKLVGFISSFLGSALGLALFMFISGATGSLSFMASFLLALVLVGAFGLPLFAIVVDVNKRRKVK